MSSSSSCSCVCLSSKEKPASAHRSPASPASFSLWSRDQSSNAQQRVSLPINLHICTRSSANVLDSASP
eukprot:6191601-Pleurochrysis_carterae.AAC.1